MVSVRDRIWRSQNKNYLRPLPERLGVRPRGRSRRLDRVLTDFGSEHSLARAAGSVVRTATLEHAQRVRGKLAVAYQQPFRVLPALGAEHVIAQADGTMICTVASGPRKGKRLRAWKEMRLVAAQAKDSTTTMSEATFGSVAETGRRWGALYAAGRLGVEQSDSRGGRWRGLDSVAEPGGVRSASKLSVRLLPRQRISGSRRTQLPACPAGSMATDATEAAQAWRR